MSVLLRPSSLDGAPLLGAGVSAWVYQLDCVAKVYTSAADRDREVAVYRRLQPDGVAPSEWHRGILRFHGFLGGVEHGDNVVLLGRAHHGSIRDYYSALFASHKGGPKDGPPPLPPLKTRLRWALSVAGAMAYAHSRGVLHADISTTNIFLTEDLEALVGDFAGSAVDDDQEPTCFYGVRYSLPGANGRVSIATEVFALGSALYGIITAHEPFHDEEDEEEVERRFRRCESPADLAGLPALADVVLGCWTGGYQTAKDVEAAVQHELDVVVSK